MTTARPDWAHPDIEFVIADGPTPGDWKGLAEMALGWREFLSAFEDHRARAGRFRELDDQRVHATVAARGKRSGTDAHTSGANVFHVTAGKVTRLVIYWDWDRALADLDLKE